MTATTVPASIDSQTADRLGAALTGPLALVERFMEDWIRSCGLPQNLRDATAYALLGGGKRLRPVLALHSCAAVGGSFDGAVPAAAALEMIHAFSLVHDDLPALDNDDTRRGLPTVHVKFGEAMAVLVGDGLMSMAFQVLAERYDARLAGLMCRELAEGSTAMIAGQVLDTLGGFAPVLDARDRLELIHRNKTGALIRASCRMGALAGRAGDGAVANITRFGESIGLMFQIVDDLIDVQQSAEHTGKRTGKDTDAGKLTYPGLIGVEASRREVERLRHDAHAAIADFGAKARPLADLCEYLAVRTK